MENHSHNNNTIIVSDYKSKNDSASKMYDSMAFSNISKKDPSFKYLLKENRMLKNTMENLKNSDLLCKKCR